MNFLKNNLKIVLPVGLIGLVAAAAIAWWLVSPLFITNQVDEAFPFEVPTSAELAAMPADKASDMMEETMVKVADAMDSGEISAETAESLQTQIEEVAATMPDEEMEEPMPEAPAEWVASAQGAFIDADDFHLGSGNATIFTQGDQSVLRLEDFEVTNGPDLHVLLIDSTASDGMGNYVDLGSLKGNVGNQNYEIPADIDLSKYDGVMIYCQPFHVVFSTAAFN